MAFHEHSGDVISARSNTASLVTAKAHAVDDIVGCTIVCSSGTYAVVLSNTAGFTPDVFVGCWRSPSAPDRLARPPAPTETYVVFAPAVADPPTAEEWAAAAAELVAHERRLR